MIALQLELLERPSPPTVVDEHIASVASNSMCGHCSARVLRMPGTAGVLMIVEPTARGSLVVRRHPSGEFFLAPFDPETQGLGKDVRVASHFATCPSRRLWSTIPA